MNDKAPFIFERFPDKGHILVFLMAEDPGFPTLSEDYHACVNALRCWEQSKKPEAEIRINGYRSLVRELEEEIIQFLRMVKLMPARK